MPIGNQLMRARVGTYNFSRKVLKPKIFSLGENNFHTVHCLSKMTYLVFMLYYFLSVCLVIFIFYKLIYVFTAYIGKSSNAVLFINDYFHNFPFVALLLFKSGDVETNPGPKKSSVINFVTEI